MPLPRRPRLGVAALLLAGACACAAPAPVAEPPPALPAIEVPRDAGGADPCTLLTAREVGAAGLRDGPGAADPHEAGCRWTAPGATLTVEVWSGSGGLATLAADSGPATARVRLGGYPALETFTGRGAFCQYDVAVAGDQVLTFALEAAGSDACVLLQRIVPAVLERLPPL